MDLTPWKGGAIAGGQYSVRLGPLEVGSLPRPQAGKIAALIDECGFFELPDRLPPGGSFQTDPLDDRLAVTDDARTHRVDWDDNSTVPHALQELADMLSDLEGWQDVLWESWHPGPA